MASVQIAGQMYRVIEEDEFGMPNLLETSDGVFKVDAWSDNGPCAIALRDPSPSYVARMQAEQRSEEQRRTAELADITAAEEAKYEAWARKRGLI